MSPGPQPDDALVLGPLLRHVDETSATVWVRTAEAATVSVERAGRTWSAPTFAVHGSHYALVVLDGLEPGSDDAYAVAVDGAAVWPLPGAPASRIRTLDPQRSTRLAFGTCRTNGSHDEAGNRAHGIDALRSLALALRDDPEAAWPDLLLLLGDQVYADTTPHAGARGVHALPPQPHRAARAWRSRTTSSTPSCTGSPGATTRSSAGCCRPCRAR